MTVLRRIWLVGVTVAGVVGLFTSSLAVSLGVFFVVFGLFMLWIGGLAARQAGSDEDDKRGRGRVNFGIAHIAVGVVVAVSPYLLTFAAALGQQLS